MQMFVRFRRHVSALTVVAAVVACGGDSSTRPTSYPPATLNQALAELSIPALAAGGPSFLGVDAATPALDPTKCPYSATVQSFVCTPISESGLTVDQSFTLLTGSGGKQSAFDAATTDAVRANTSVAGTLVEQGTTLDVSGQQELTLSGLVSGPHVLNGTSSLTAAGTVEDQSTTYPVNIPVRTSIPNLGLPVNEPGSSQVGPSSGSITVDVNGSIGPVSVSQARTKIEFSGTSIVTVTVSGGGLSKNCKVDLAQAAPVCE
jgi:hypothetical protein